MHNTKKEVIQSVHKQIDKKKETEIQTNRQRGKAETMFTCCPV